MIFFITITDHLLTIEKNDSCWLSCSNSTQKNNLMICILFFFKFLLELEYSLFDFIYLEGF